MEQPNRTPNREARRAAVKALPKDGDELTGLVELDIRAAGQEWSERHGCHAPIRAWRGSQLSIQEYIAIGSSPIVIARLSVRRHDGKPLSKHWDTLYRIKTMLYPEHEAVEIHPPSGKLIDDAPMYHVWILEENCTVGCNLGPVRVRDSGGSGSRIGSVGRVRDGRARGVDRETKEQQSIGGDVTYEYQQPDYETCLNCAFGTGSKCTETCLGCPGPGVAGSRWASTVEPKEPEPAGRDDSDDVRVVWSSEPGSTSIPRAVEIWMPGMDPHERYSPTSQLEQMQRERDSWIESAREFCNGMEYYRGLLDEIGKSFGAEAYTSNDGSVQQDVLRAKVPELVEQTRKALGELVEAIGHQAIPDLNEDTHGLQRHKRTYDAYRAARALLGKP